VTDARFPERWLSDKRLMRLSPEHFRAFMTSLAWSVSNRTDGVIEPEDLALIPHFATGAAQAFVDAGLWGAREHGWYINGFETTQTTREQLAHLEEARAKGRERQARHRAAKRADDTAVTRDVQRDVTVNDIGQDRTGQDRLLQEGLNQNGTVGNGTKPHPLPCRYCDTEIEPHLQFQRMRGYCDSPECKAEAKAELS
jgi:hypothetical protein